MGTNRRSSKKSNFHHHPEERVVSTTPDAVCWYAPHVHAKSLHMGFCFRPDRSLRSGELGSSMPNAASHLLQTMTTIAAKGLVARCGIDRHAVAGPCAASLSRRLPSA